MGMIANHRFELLTPTGFKDFAGVRITEQEHSIRITTEEGTIECTVDHRFEQQVASDLKVGDRLTTAAGTKKILGVQLKEGTQLFYDPVEVAGGHLYLSNGIVSHNCEFLSSDALLINSLKLHQIASKKVHHEDMGFKFWVPEDQLGGANRTYMISLDPATGGGKDFSVIEVFDFPGLNQIAEYRTNDVNIPLLYAKLKWIIQKLSDYGGRGRAEVLWTFERNGIGEAVSALYQNDEKQPEYAELFCDAPGKFGVYTTGKTKVLSCLQLKQLVEKTKGGFTINSEQLLFELKNFIAKGGSYEAKSGATDDTVMATIGIVRLLKRLSEWNDEAFQQVNEYVDPGDDLDPFGNEPVPWGVV